MKRLHAVVLLLIAVVALPLWAMEVTPERAKRVAEACARNMSELSALRSGGASAVTLAYTAASALRSTAADYFVFNVGDEGFVVVSGDDRAEPVLGYSAKGTFRVDSIAPALAWMLERYQAQIRLLADSLPVVAAWETFDASAMPAASTVVYLETAEWGQDDPYNRQCPTEGNQRTLTGCVATAMAELLKYHSDHFTPQVVGSGTHVYTWNGQSLGVNFGDYDWANMPMKTSDFTADAQRNAVARLIHHCGVAVESDYDLSGTGAYLTGTAKDFADIGINATSVEQALPRWFGFSSDCSARYLNYKWDPTRGYVNAPYTEQEYAAIIKAELNNQRPVIMAGTDEEDSYSGHCWLCNGYDDSDKYYFNWGWKGGLNGWFRLYASGNAASPSMYGYNLEMLTAVYRPVAIEKDPANTDTVYVYIHDTVTVAITVHDTVVKERVVEVHDTVTYFIPAETIVVHDTFILPVETLLITIHDTVERIVHDTVPYFIPAETIVEHDTLWLPGTPVYVHDTIDRIVEVYNTDTVYVVIEEATATRYTITENAKVYSLGNTLYIQGLTPEQPYTLYTTTGTLYTRGTATQLGTAILLDLPPALYILHHAGRYTKFVHK